MGHAITINNTLYCEPIVINKNKPQSEYSCSGTPVDCVKIALNSILDDVPSNLPSLTRAKKLQKRAKRVGFDWNDANEVMKKLDEEISELKFEHEKKSKAGISEEMGDIFFTLVNLSRYYDIEPEDVIRRTNLKFEKRFKDMENLSKERGNSLDDMSLEEMEQLWQEVK